MIFDDIRDDIRLEDLLGKDTVKLHNAAALIHDTDPFSRRIGKVGSTMKLGITACIHGNEPVGLKVIDWLLQNDKHLGIEVRYSIGNPFATLKLIRDTGTNMNRMFPGRIEGCYEEQQAYRVMQAMEGVNLYIDFHSTTRSAPPFIVFVKGRDAKKLIKATGLERVVVYPEQESGKGYAGMISLQAVADAYGAAVIAIECGRHTAQETFITGLAIIQNVLRSYDVFDGKPPTEVLQNMYSDLNVLYETEPGMRINPEIQEFQYVKKGTIVAYGEKNLVASFDFYPIIIDYYDFQREGKEGEKSLMLVAKLRNQIPD